MITEARVREAIAPIEDPELHLPLLGLGLIYKIEVLNEGKQVVITMTLTSMACPLGPEMIESVQNAAAALEGVEDVKVNLVFNPPWDPRTMANEDVQMALGLF